MEGGGSEGEEEAVNEDVSHTVPTPHDKCSYFILQTRTNKNKIARLLLLNEKGSLIWRHSQAASASINIGTRIAHLTMFREQRCRVHSCTGPCGGQ